jgi:hypothetical protein
MSNFTDFISSGGGGGGLPVNIILGHSQTWVPPVDGNICIHVVGGGGGATGSAGNQGAMSGGGAGYCKKNSLAVTTSGSFTVVVGAGGAGNRSGVYATNGGNSTVAGTGLGSTLTANGGTGAGGSSQGTGGTAANGDVNNTGGAGGYTGGGAVGITGTGNAGGASGAGQVPPYSGGPCDVVGPESLMGHGYICGGLGGDYYRSWTGQYPQYGIEMLPYSPNGNGGFLAGGGAMWTAGTLAVGGLPNYPHGGNGGIGGGGGGCSNDRGANYASGGSGGNGIVIIQYLPA